jgi:hypothetical protein
MSDLNFNTHPYWDDFDSSKNYQRILYIPGRAPQARELTQSQTIIQNQVKKIGDSLYKNGTILRGCILSINSSKTLAWISAGDVYVDGLIVTFEGLTEIPIVGIDSEIIGLVKTEAIITESDDNTLRDPAQGYDNYNEPGGHRLQTSWRWDIIDPTTSDVVGVTYRLGIYTLTDGDSPTIEVVPDITQQILDISAKRDYQKSGNYVLSGLKLKLFNHPTEEFDYKRLVIESGVARIQGYDIALSTNSNNDIPVARQVETLIGEPWVFVPYNITTGLGGSYRLGHRPVNKVIKVVATVLVCDGYGSKPSIARGAIPGGTDELSENSVESIIGVNYGGIWNPLGGSGGTGVFEGGTNYVEGIDFLKDGNRIDWSLSGLEPPSGVNYKVAFTFRKTLTKQVFEKTEVMFEAHVHGSGDILDHPYVCEINDYTEAIFKIADPVGEDPPADLLTNDYTKDVDYSLDESGLLEWFDYEVQVKTVSRSGGGATDTISGLSDGYSFYQILDVAYYSPGNPYVFNDDTLSFVDPTTSYYENTNYTYTVATPTITWTNSPPLTDYVVAVLGKKYKTSNHPTVGHTFYVSYHYWDTKVSGDYASRDSYFSTWVGAGDASNVYQRYGLDIFETVNFRLSDSYRTNTGFMNKPYPGSLVEIDYEYCLSQYLVVEFNKNGLTNLTYGNPSKYPTEPVYDEKLDSILLGKVYCPADSLDMVSTEFGVTTLKVIDLHNMRDRIIRTEQNLADTWLDMEAKSMEVSNKTGISTSSFRDNSRFDLGWSESAFAIDPDWEELTLPHIDYLYYTEIDEARSTGQAYTTVCTMVPNGTETISQPYYTGSESIAPYAAISQDMMMQSQSVYMNLMPSGDPLIIPKNTSVISGTDADLWSSSDIALLSDPSPWFSKGWRGNQQAETSESSTTLTQTWSSTYIKNINGVCRKLSVLFDIPGGLTPVVGVELDYFVYFGETLVTVELINGTPVGSVANSFRPRPSDRGATGRFTIPSDVPEGCIEVKAISSPVPVNGQDWRVTVSAIYNATVTQELTSVFNRCRCNCYGCNRCSNCWSCTGRCGTGPVAETLESEGRLRVLKNIEFDFYSVHPSYGVYGVIINTNNGEPSSNSVSNSMIARKFMGATYLVGAGPKVCEFDDPVYLKNESYAIVLTAEDGFNLNYATEVSAGRDIRCKVATLGERDNTTQVAIGTQPFNAGSFWRSLTGTTWTKDVNTDLKFTATFNTYSTSAEQIIQTNPIDLYDATAFICTWNSIQVDGTFIVFEYKTDQEAWTEFAPYVLTKLEYVANTITLRARMLTRSANVTPFLERFCGLYVQSSLTDMKAVTKRFELPAGDTADTLDIWIDSHLPTGCSQLLHVSFDNGTNWIRLDEEDGGLESPSYVTVTEDSQVVDLNVETSKTRYHWNIVLSSGHTFSSYRVKITSRAIGASAKLANPRFSKYISITSNS